MKILVIDDNAVNRDAAKAQFSDYDFTVIGSYDEAEALLRRKHKFEVVLVDLMLPASSNNQGSEGKCFVGQEMPIGIFLALLAAKNGAKHVAVFTDADHHSHPASACFDPFNIDGQPQPFMVEGAKFFLSNNSNWISNFRPDNLAKEMDYDEIYKQKKPSVRAKNWKKLFLNILSLEKKENDDSYEE